MRVKKLLLKIGLTLVVIIIVMEITLRLTIPAQLQIRAGCEYQPDSVLGYRYKANATGLVYNAAFSRPYAVNSEGFAGREFATKKVPGIYRIAIIGASAETGLYTNGPLNYVTVAEDLFKKNGYKVQIINLAIDGHGRSYRNVEFVKRECAVYEPDLILFRDIEFPLEDFMQYRTTYKDVTIKYTDTSKVNLMAAKAYIDKELSHKDFRQRLFDYSYIYRYMVKNYLHKYQKSDFWERVGRPFFESPNKMECYARHLIFWPRYKYTPTKYSEEESMQIYKDLHTELLKRNTKLIVYNTYKIHDAPWVIQFFAKYQVNYLPLEVAYKNEYSFGKLDGHPSEEGHKVIGGAMFNALKDSIPSAYRP